MEYSTTKKKKNGEKSVTPKAGFSLKSNTIGKPLVRLRKNTNNQYQE